MTSRIIARLVGHPWLIQSDALDTMLALAAREVPDEATIDAWKRGPERQALATRQGDSLGNAPTARVRNGVAVVPVAGPIFRYANLMTNFSGATALSDFAANMAAAMADSRVKSILLEIDSPGGEVTGLAEAAQLVADAARVKPVAAFVEGSAMSAGYWLASAAGEIVISSTGAVGSLGAVVAMQDSRESQVKAGVRRYQFVSSQTPNKMFDPTTDAGAARLQAFADRIASEFLTEAAANRGMTVDGLLSASDGGGVLVGADAVAAGLADSVGGFEATLARLAAGDAPLRAARTPTGRTPVARADNPTPGPALLANIEEPTMSDPASSPVPALAPETPIAANPAPAPVIAAPAPVDPVVAERARSAAILAAAHPEFAALASLAVANGWPVDQFTAAQNASASAVANARTQATAGAFRDSLPAPIAGGGGAPDAPTDPLAKASAEFAASDALQREFGTESRYLAYCQAVAAGKVRVISKRA